MPVSLDFIPAGSIPLKPVIKQEIIDMIIHYRTNVNLRLTDPIKSAWVSIDEINALIQGNPGANGIRIYFGRHKNSTMGVPTPQGPITVEYKDMQTVILVCTRDSTNPANPTTENSIDMLTVTASVGNPANLVSYTGSGGDFVPLCPPRCNSASL